MNTIETRKIMEWMKYQLRLSQPKPLTLQERIVRGLVAIVLMIVGIIASLAATWFLWWVGFMDMWNILWGN